MLLTCRLTCTKLVLPVCLYEPCTANTTRNIGTAAAGLTVWAMRRQHDAVLEYGGLERLPATNALKQALSLSIDERSNQARINILCQVRQALSV